jgi:hypothetical protein
MAVKWNTDGVTQMSSLKQNFLTAPIVLCGFLAVVVGCGHSTADTKNQIDQAVQAMAQAKSPDETVVADGIATPVPTPVQQMNDALASYKAGDYPTTVTRFQAIRAHTPMSGAQILALNNAVAAVVGDLYTRASKGDAGAIEAVRQYEQMQTQRR